MYGLGYLAFVALIVFFVYLIRFSQPPTCFDGKLNQDEEEVDCGGVCPACNVRRVRPIEISSLESVVVRDITIAVVEIKNPNNSYGAKDVDYSLLVKDQLGESIRINDSTFLYPSEIRYRVLIDVPAESGQPDALPYSFSTSTLTWVSAEDLIRPRTQLRDVRSEFDGTRKVLIVQGVLKNDNDFSSSEAIVNAIVRDGFGKLIGASKTLLKDLGANEERYFQIIVPIQAGVAEGDISDPRITVEIVR